MLAPILFADDRLQTNTVRYNTVRYVLSGLDSVIGGREMRVIGYVRVSTDEQANYGQSLGAQKAKLRAYADLYDLKLTHIIEDTGVSAKSLKREGLQQALKMLKVGNADGILVAKLDRLTRSVMDGGALISEYFGEGGSQLFSVADSIDTRTAAGRLVLNVLLSVSQWEREAIGERTRDALQHKIRNGERCGKIRFGYDLAEDGRSLISNAVEQEAITLMKALKKEGQTLRAIAIELDSRGIQTKEGRRWNHSSVHGILNRAA